MKRSGYRFVDTLRLHVTGGSGGNGAVAYRYMGRKKRPTGGHGGRGGDVIIRACKDTQNLNFGRPHIKAGHGERGGGNGWQGKLGKSKEILVPIGTIVEKIIRTENQLENVIPFHLDRSKVLIENLEEDDYEDDSSISEDESEDDYDSSDEDDFDEDDYDDLPKKNTVVEQFWADLDADGKGLVVATGGRGGRGNGDLAALSFQFYEIDHNHRRLKGKPGTTNEIRLTLKSIADIGLVGFPNAGKSTLLGSISKAKPQVASFPFTTLHPSIGTIEFTDSEQVTVADIPGLIEGAHENRGLGHRFLRHVERTNTLAYIIDCSSAFKTPLTDVTGLDLKIDIIEPEYLDVIRKYALLVKELELYLEGLSSKPSILVLNKMDTEDAHVLELEKLKTYIASMPPVEFLSDKTFQLPIPNAIHQVSAKYGRGIGELVYTMRDVVEKQKR